MVQTNTYLDLVGAPPAPHTMAFMRWKDDYFAKRKAACNYKRSTVFYISPSGSDAANGTSPSTPWQTLDRVKTEIETNNRSEASFLFLRGSTFTSYTTITIDQPGIHIGAYGAFPASGIVKPRMSFWTITYPESANSWSSAAGNRYTTTVSAATANPSSATRLGWLRLTADPLNPLTAVDSTAKVEAQSYSWYCDSSGNVHVNLGGTDPNTVDLEAIPHLSGSGVDCFLVAPGSHGFWCDEIYFDGYDCTAWGSRNAWGVRLQQEDDETGYISNCEGYYQGRHSICSQESAGSGSYAIFENCLTGYCCPVFDATVCNSYCANGLGEYMIRNCWIRFGHLPNDIATSLDTVAQASCEVSATYYGHAGGTSPNRMALWILDGGGPLDERSKYSRATATGDRFSFASTGNTSYFPNTSDYTPGANRCYVIGYQGQKSLYSGSGSGGPITINPWFTLINCYFPFRVPNGGYGGTPDQIFAFACGICAINTILDITWEGTATGNPIVEIFPQNAATTIGPRLINCMIIIRGTTDAGTNSYATITHRYHGPVTRIGNTILVCPDKIMNSTTGLQLRASKKTFSDGLRNTSSSLRYLAIGGCLLNDTGTASTDWAGFSAATGLVQLDSLGEMAPMTLDPVLDGGTPALSGLLRSFSALPADSPLAGAGVAVPFPEYTDVPEAPQYDFLGHIRPAVPSIGPIDLDVSGELLGGDNSQLGYTRWTRGRQYANPNA